MEKRDNLKRAEDRWYKARFCTKCEHFKEIPEICGLLKEVSIRDFEKLLAAPCDISNLIKKKAMKLAAPVSHHMGDIDCLADELAQEALFALVKKFQKGEFQYQGLSRTIEDILKFAATVMRHYLTKAGTVKKIQGRYCVHFIEGCTLKNHKVERGDNAGAVEAFPHFRSKECREVNPGSLIPPCRHFTSPRLDSIYADEAGDSAGQNENKVPLIDMLQSGEDEISERMLEWKDMVKSMWMRAESVPEMRHIIRLVKYRMLLENDQRVSNIVKIGEVTKVDPSTIHNDLEMLEKWRRANE